MEREESIDSYCTTEDEAASEKGYESDLEQSITDEIGSIEKIKEENIYKEILEIGEGKKKPCDIDTVIISTNCFIKLKHNELENILQIPVLSYNHKEFSLDDIDNPIPKAISLGIQTMRRKEKAKIFIKMKYIFKYLDKNMIKLSNELNKILFDEDFRKEYQNEKLICELLLDEFFICENLMDKGEIRKKILSKGRMLINARNPDIAKFNLTCKYRNKIIYEKTNVRCELDIGGSLYEIEKRIVQNLKIGEISEIRVKPSYMRDKNKEFLSYYNLDNEEDTMFLAELIDIEVFDYVFKPNKDKISKKSTLHKGFGRDSPDRESIVKLKMQIKFEGKILYNNFEEENIIDDYLKNDGYTKSYLTWRNKINGEYSINEIGEEVNYVRDEEIFTKFETDYNKLAAEGKIKTCDLRLYTLPLIVRKVLIHMKRNEIVYVKTNYIDCLDFESIPSASVSASASASDSSINLDNLGDVKSEKANLEIYIHLFEFLERRSFSKLANEDKLNELSKMKEIANGLFKEGKLFRSGKIYQNINSRFSYGSVFKANSDVSVNAKIGESSLEQDHQSEIYKDLIGLRLSTFNNCAAVKLKLAKYFSCYDLTKKVLTEFDGNNVKAYYLHGRSCIQLKFYEEAIRTLKRLNEISPGCEEFSELLRDAENLRNEELKRQKNIYKKMIFSN